MSKEKTAEENIKEVYSLSRKEVKTESKLKVADKEKWLKLLEKMEELSLLTIKKAREETAKEIIKIIETQKKQIPYVIKREVKRNMDYTDCLDALKTKIQRKYNVKKQEKVKGV